MSIKGTITAFLESVDRAERVLKSYRNVIEDRQSKISEVVSLLAENDINNAEYQGSKIKEICLSELKKFEKTIYEYVKNINSYVEKKEFVNQFEKSVLLIVFADVKAGKSTLGNFVSGYYLKGTKYEYLYNKPEFWIYDYSDSSGSTGDKKLIENSFFPEDEVEATSTIQYYTLNNGLTWVDTPGIGSLTRENEQLAEEYTKFADLILFLTPSNNPCKQDEAYQIKKLIMKDKPLLITITKSDKRVKELVDNKLVSVTKAKTNENRKTQEDYLSNVIQEMGGNNILSQNKYISISTQLAKEAVKEDDEKKFEDSNIPQFYNFIGEIISESALELKMKRPKDEINSVINDIIEGTDTLKGLKEIIESMKNLLDRIDNYKKAIGDTCGQILLNVKDDSMTDVYRILNKYKTMDALNEKSRMEIEIEKAVSDNILKYVNNYLSEVIEDFNENVFEDFDLIISGKYEKKTEVIEYQTLDLKVSKRAPKGLIEHVEKLFFGKEFTETRTKKINNKKVIDVGDNFNEFINSTWNDVEEQVKNVLNTYIETVKTDYFGNMENKVKNIVKKSEDTLEKLNGLKF